MRQSSRRFASAPVRHPDLRRPPPAVVDLIGVERRVLIELHD